MRLKKRFSAIAALLSEGRRNVRRLCSIAGVSPKCYYAYAKGPSDKVLSDERLNVIIRDLQELYGNSLGYRKMTTSIFLAEERDELLPLPISEYRTYIEKEAVVDRDFHIQYSKAHYSLPTKYIGEKVTVRDDGTDITIYDRLGQKIAHHRKALREWEWVMDRDHIPEKYGENRGYSPEYFLTWASKFGKETTSWVEYILGHFQTTVRAFNTLFTSLQAANKYEHEVVENTSCHALGSRICASKDYKILLDRYERSSSKPAEDAVDLDDIFVSH